MKQKIAGFLVAVLLLCPLLAGGIRADAATNDDKIKQYGNEWTIQYDEISQRVSNTSDSGIVAAQNLFITYSGLTDQRAEMNRTLQVLKKNYEASRKKLELKMITELDLLNIKRKLDTLESNISKMDLETEQLRKTIGTMVGSNYKGIYDDNDKTHRINLKNLPNVHTFVKDLDMDYTKDIEGITGSGDEASTEQAKAAFSKIYRTVKEEQTLLEQEESFYELEKKNFEAAKVRNAIGILSNLELINAQDKLDAQAYKVKTVQMNLFTAAAKYQWAVNYNILA